MESKMPIVKINVNFAPSLQPRSGVGFTGRPQSPLCQSKSIWSVFLKVKNYTVFLDCDMVSWQGENRSCGAGIKGIPPSHSEASNLFIATISGGY